MTVEAVAPGMLIDPDVPIPEASILKTTEFGVQPEPTLQGLSGAKMTVGQSRTDHGEEAESPETAARRADLANLEREESQQPSIRSDSKPSATTNWV